MDDSQKKPGEARGGILAGFAELDQILKGDLTRLSTLRRRGLDISLERLSRIIIVLGMAYGFCMGMFAVFRLRGPSALQLVASMVKVPLLFYLTLLVTLPSLYVFNALVGSRLTLGTIIRLLTASLGVMVTVLASLGPIVAFFSVSTTSYPFMILFNVVIFAVSGSLGLMFLLQTLQRLSTLDAQTAPPPDDAASESVESVGAINFMENQALGKHVKRIFQIWVIVFGLVGAQMGWVLRPFIGNPEVGFVWFRGRNSNFFQAVFQTFFNLFS
jgi:hypothetical protein